MNLDGKTIANIFLGKVTNWNDPAIKALNKGCDMPDLKITPIFRSDGSGTTYNFTDYLSAVQPRMEVEGRHLNSGQLAGRSRRPRLTRVWRVSSRAPRAASPTPTSPLR